MDREDDNERSREHDGAQNLLKETYSTQQIAQLLGINIETLRFYEREGLVRPSRRDNGYREWSYQDLRTLLDVVAFRHGGFSLEEIREVRERNTLAQNKELFEEVSRRLERRIVKLQTIQRATKTTLATYDTIAASQNAFFLRPLGNWRQVKIDTDISKRGKGAESRSDLLEVTYMVEHYIIEGSCVRISDAFFGVEAEVAAELGVATDDFGDDLRRTHPCVYTVVNSTTGSLEPDSARPAIEWAKKHSHAIGTDLYAICLADSAGAFWVELYIPLAGE